MFWDNYVKLCGSNNKSPNGVANELNLSSGSITAWKKGAVPRAATLQKIADYFGVSVASLLGEDEPDLREKAETNRETILRITESAEENLMHLFMLKLFELPEDQRDTLRNLFKLPADEFRRAMDMLNIMYKK
jgi:transcriptional regulator with XRE-family HTH domain